MNNHISERTEEEKGAERFFAMSKLDNPKDFVMGVRSHRREGFAWLELLLVLTLLALLFQLFPSLWLGALWALDIRNWPRTLWFAATWLVLLTLVAIRFGPDLYADWCGRRERRAVERARNQKQQELNAQRETLARMKEAMKRRVV